MAEYNWDVDALLIDMDWLEEQVEEALKKAKCEIRTAYVGSPHGLPAFIGVSYQDDPSKLKYENPEQQEADVAAYQELQKKIVKTLDSKVFGDFKLQFEKHLDGETIFMLGQKIKESGPSPSAVDEFLESLKG